MNYLLCISQHCMVSKRAAQLLILLQHDSLMVNHKKQVSGQLIIALKKQLNSPYVANNAS